MSPLLLLGHIIFYYCTGEYDFIYGNKKVVVKHELSLTAETKKVQEKHYSFCQS